MRHSQQPDHRHGSGHLHLMIRHGLLKKWHENGGLNFEGIMETKYMCTRKAIGGYGT